jgi:F-type H+-transporting ATPase subunit gamma
MPNSKEIRSKITSVKNTQKITRAMQMVAISKIRKAEARMLASMPYANRIRFVIGHVACSHSKVRSPFLEKREQIKRVGYIVISSDRGLCGGLNINLFRNLLPELMNWEKQGVAVNLCLIGRKAEIFFKQRGFNIVAHSAYLGDTPEIADLLGATRVMTQSYAEGELDRIFITYNEFINTMTQRPKIDRLFPLVITEDECKGRYWDYIYEPDAQPLLNTLVTRYAESQIYQAAIDNTACEQAARLVAMKNATDNAEQLIGDMQLLYNKSRQAAITQEISEIIGGAAAV